MSTIGDRAKRVAAWGDRHGNRRSSGSCKPVCPRWPRPLCRRGRTSRAGRRGGAVGEGAAV